MRTRLANYIASGIHAGPLRANARAYFPAPLTTARAAVAALFRTPGLLPNKRDRARPLILIYAETRCCWEGDKETYAREIPETAPPSSKNGFYAARDRLLRRNYGNCAGIVCADNRRNNWASVSAAVHRVESQCASVPEVRVVVRNLRFEAICEACC